MAVHECMPMRLIMRKNMYILAGFQYIEMQKLLYRKCDLFEWTFAPVISICNDLTLMHELLHI